MKNRGSYTVGTKELKPEPKRTAKPESMEVL